jgi:hypothetical protein
MVSGRPKIQKAMSLWYQNYRLPPNTQTRYQYSIFDSIQTGRTTVSMEEAMTLSRAMPRLDMLAVTSDMIHLVELKPNAQLKDVGQVLQYEKYLKRDIFIAQHLNRPIKRVLVSLTENASVRAACGAEDIEYIVIPAIELPAVPD